MFLKTGLGWLPGFPLAPKDGGLEWLIVPREDGHSIKRHRLSKEHLQKAVYSHILLVRHFPRALPRAVDEIQAWKRGVPLLLDLLKPSLLADKPCPPSVFDAKGVFPVKAIRMGEELRKRSPFLEGFLDALSYILFLNPEELAPACRWTSLHAEGIQNILAAFPGEEGLLRLVRLWELSRRSHYRETEFLIELLGDKRTLACPTQGWSPYLLGLRNAITESTSSFFRRTLPAAPTPVLGDELFEFVAWALQQPQDVIRRAVQLLKIVLDFDFLTAWVRAWRRMEDKPEIRRHIKSKNPDVIRKEIERFETRINGLLLLHPPEIHIKTLLNLIRAFSSPHRASLFPAVCRALRALPPHQGGAAVRAAFLHNWAAAEKISGPLFPAVLQRFARSTSANRGSAAWLKPWENILQRWSEGPGWASDILEIIFQNPKDPALVEACFRALDQAVASKPEGLDYGEAGRLIDLVLAVKDADLALRYARSFPTAQGGSMRLEERLIRTAQALDPRDEEFGSLCINLNQTDPNADELNSVLGIDRDLRKQGWGPLAKEALLDRDGAAVFEIAERRKALESLKGNVDPPLPVPSMIRPEWVSRYPAEFVQTLTALSLLTPKAERTARRVFGHDFIPPDALRKEIAVLEEKIKPIRLPGLKPGVDSGLILSGAFSPDLKIGDWRRKRIKPPPAADRLDRRLANLRSRLAAATRIAPNRLTSLQKRLARAVRREVFDQWRLRLDRDFQTRLMEMLGADTAPPELLDPGFLPVLISIMRLPALFRKVGIEFLRRRCGPPPWNLHDHPANRAFLKKIEKEGIDAGPWIFPDPPRIVEAENGRRLKVGLENDPLEIFRMGAYFNTCLSPGGVNFYSVISNAADINKRVLFARDENGQVVGRCLFALSDRGGLLTFHPYEGHKSLGFQGIVSRSASELAARMKTAVIPGGQVERLVLPKWYDDGPRDTGGGFPWLKEKSAFRSRLETVKVEEIADAVKNEFAPLAANSLTLSPIVMLSEFEDRPELIVPLLALLEACEDVAIEVWTRAADLARQAGRLDQARRILHKRILPQEYRQLKNGNLDEECIKLALNLDPSAMLRLFRRTRPPGVKNDRKEPAHRRKYIAGAHEALGRAQLSRRLADSPSD